MRINLEENTGKHSELYEPADIMIHVQGRGIVLKEKSILAYQKSDNKIVAFGAEAEPMAGRDMEDIVVVSPLRQGRVADYSGAVALFSHMLIKALGKKPILRPAAAVCVPPNTTPVERRAMEEVLAAAAAKEVFITDTPLEELIREVPDKFKIIFGIVKEEPERYIKESLREMLAYALQEQIPQDRVYELLQNLKRSREKG